MDALFSNPPEWLVFVALGAAAVSALIAFVAAVAALGARRRATRSSSELLSLNAKLGEVEASLARRIDEAQLSLNQKLEEARSSLAGDVERAKADAGAVKGLAEDARTEVVGVVDRLVKFEEYFRTVFEAQLSSTFSSFDQTVSDVLGQMQSELQRGISRINQMQAMVQSRGQAEKRLTESKEQVQRLLKAGESADAAPAGDTKNPSAPTDAGETLKQLEEESPPATP